jgi:hypothetical protein
LCERYPVPPIQTSRPSLVHPAARRYHPAKSNERIRNVPLTITDASDAVGSRVTARILVPESEAGRPNPEYSGSGGHRSLLRRARGDASGSGQHGDLLHGLRRPDYRPGAAAHRRRRRRDGSRRRAERLLLLPPCLPETNCILRSTHALSAYATRYCATASTWMCFPQSSAGCTGGHCRGVPRSKAP